MRVFCWLPVSSQNVRPSYFVRSFPNLMARSYMFPFTRHGWVTVCKYLLKEDSDPFFWGNGDLITVQESIPACANHTRNPSSNMQVIEKRKTLDDWEQVYVYPDLVDIVFRSYNTLRAVYEYMRLIKDSSSSLHTRLITPIFRLVVIPPNIRFWIGNQSPICLTGSQ